MDPLDAFLEGLSDGLTPQVKKIPTGVTKDESKPAPGRQNLGLIKRTGEECIEFIFDFVMRMEGGDKYTNIPGDRGGPTKYGVTQTTYDSYRFKAKKPQQTVRNISKAEALDVFKTGYWNVVGADKLGACTALAVVDFAYNSGPSRSLRYLRAITKEPFAYAFHNGDEKLAVQLTVARKQFFANLAAADPSQKKFLNGWFNRIDAVLQACHELNK